ncbi:MAG TPA: hypothetical protein VEK57_21020 [Thermoanaerobaculia bacterium]|nr:hypothetical protein [Thermoanaerobaculia bacterium]
MREFSVFVTGIAAFVEDYRRALAVHAPRPVSVKIREGRRHSDYATIPAHFAHVRVPLNDVDAATQTLFPIMHDWNVAEVPGVFRADNPPLANDMVRQTLVKFLRFQEVILPDSETPATLDEAALTATGIPTPADKTSVRWLASMESLGTTAKTIDPRHIVENPTDVAAYIRFPNGRISTAFAPQFKFVSVNALDAKPAGILDQAVAQLVVCRFDVSGAAFTVKCRGYNGGDSFDITFKEGVAEPWMVFACTSLEDALQLRLDGDKFGVDLHFQLVYALAEGQVSDAEVALPKSIDPAPGIGEGKPLGAGGCVPIRFSGGSTGGG